MSYNLIILTSAKKDIREAAIWYNKIQKQLGKRFINSVRKEIITISKNPYLYEVKYDDVRLALTDTFPYTIHFTMYDKSIVIKAIYHTSRNYSNSL